MKLFRLLFLNILLVVFANHANAQDPYFVSINKMSGLPSNSIYALFQDSKGFIWIANNEGLTRYDGFEFKTYINPGQSSRSGNQIEEDKFGRIWYKNFDGYLYYVENDSLKSLKQNTTIGNTGYAIIEDRLIVIQKYGVDLYDLSTLNTVKNISLPFILNALVSELHYKDHYYIMTEDSLFKLSKDGSIQGDKNIPLDMLAGAKNGIVAMKKNNSERKCYLINNGILQEKIATTGIRFIHELDYCDSMYWMSTPNGVWVFDESGTNINGTVPFFPSKSISSVMKDREGNFWLGTLNEGIIFIPDLKAKLFTTPDFSPNILSVVNGKLFIGTKDNAIYMYDLDLNKFERKYKDSLRHEIICFFGDTTNNSYAFTADQFVVTDRNFKVLKSYLMSTKDVTTVDKKYNAIATNGMIALLKKRDDIASSFDSLFSASISSNYPDVALIVVGCRGRSVAYNSFTSTIYAGTSRGLFAVDPQNTAEIKYNNEALYTRRMTAVGKKVYLVTPQNKLLVIDEYQKAHLLPLTDEKEQCMNIKYAGGHLYLLTNNGIRILDPLTGKITMINLHPGIRIEEINDMEQVGEKLIFSSERGLIVQDARQGEKDIVAPKLVINSLTVNGSTTQIIKDIALEHTQNDIEIRYSILSFSADRKYQLYYKINDGSWQVNSNVTRSLKLASLSPGMYHILFRLVSVDSGRYYAEREIDFRIKRALWQEWWFLAGCMLILAAGGYVYYNWQTRLLKKQNQLTVEKVELEKNLRNSMLTSIRSQMNPHFFYNALNAIQSFIFSDDKRNASTYLVKLSKLTRLILEMSEKESITLEEETEALKLYLELEKMRFTTDFNYELHLDKNVETELVKIPPMIVQPFIENAIKHGLLHKKGNKYLSITFRKEGDNLVITIDDNGIGRAKATELKQLKKEKYSPFSTEANGKRIELLNRGRSKNIGILYIDKTDGSGIPTGTTVIISIPLI